LKNACAAEMDTQGLIEDFKTSIQEISLSEQEFASILEINGRILKQPIKIAAATNTE
jgi:hypothetical protein